MANFKLNQTGEQIQADLNLLDSNSATQGQVLTANGTGGASWQNASGGTEVVANPTLSGSESDLTGLEVAGTKYKVPTGGSGGGTQLYKHTILFNRTSTDRDELYIISNINIPLNSFSDVEVWDFYIIVPNSYIINDSGNQVYVGNCYIFMERLSGVGYNRKTGAVEAIKNHDLVEGNITDTVTPL